MGFLAKLFGHKPPNSVQAQQLHNDARFNANWAHTFEAKRLPDPGVQNYAYENLGLNEFSPIGPSEHNRQRWMITQPKPLFAGLGLSVSGIGGLSNGQLISQPLIDPNNPTGLGG